jgi:phosphoribosylformylglycinamidine (FGAM) synthase PurS component
MQVIGQIDPALYWEWRCTIEEQHTARLKYEVAMHKMQAMEREIELLKLRAAIFKMNEVTQSKEKITLQDSEYEKMKKRVEESCGVELKDCVIDEYSYEIKKLD